MISELNGGRKSLSCGRTKNKKNRKVKLVEKSQRKCANKARKKHDRPTMSQIRLRKSTQSESGSKQLCKKSETRRDFSDMPRENSQVALITGESKKGKLLLVLGTTCVVFLCTAVVFGSLYAVSVSKQHSSASVNKQTSQYILRPLL